MKVKGGESWGTVRQRTGTAVRVLVNTNLSFLIWQRKESGRQWNGWRRTETYLCVPRCKVSWDGGVPCGGATAVPWVREWTRRTFADGKDQWMHDTLGDACGTLVSARSGPGVD